MAKRALKIFVGIAGAAGVVVIPLIVLNYQGVGKPFTGFFTILFVNEPVGAFLDSGLVWVAQAEACAPFAYCSVTLGGWMLLVAFWLLMAGALAGVLAGLTAGLSRLRKAAR